MKMFYSGKEISLAVPCPYSRVLKAIQIGDLPAQTLGASYMVNANDAEEWIQRAQAITDPAYVLTLEAEIAFLKAENAELRGSVA